MMNPERFQELLNTYGGLEEHWPDEHRPQMHACLEAFPEMHHEVFEAQKLDHLLNSYEPTPADLQERILAALPTSIADRIFRWLVPDAPLLWWRPVMAATLPLVVGLLIGMESQLASTDWELQERSLLMPVAGELWYE